MRRLPATALMFCLAAATLSAAPPAGSPGATRPVLETIGVAELADLLRTEGYAAAPSASGKDVTWKLDGTSARVFVAADGSNVQFYVGIKGKPVTLAAVNDFNRTQRYARAYLDDVGDPCLELDLDLVGGVTRERVVDWAKTASVSFADWRSTVLK